MRISDISLAITAIRGGGAPPPDPDAAMQALMADGAHLALDTADLSRMWQDSPPVTPTTTVGQDVATILSKFGTTSYTFYRTGGLVPVYGGGTGWLLYTAASTELLASDDALGVLNGASGVTLGSGIFLSSLSITSCVISISSGISTTVSRAALQVNTNGSVQLFCKRLDADTISSITSAAGVITLNNYYSIIGVVDVLTTGAMTIYVNGVSVATGTISGTAGNFSATNSQRFRIGNTVAASSQYVDGYVRRPFLLRKPVSGGDIVTLDEWCSGLLMEGGAYLLKTSAARTWFDYPYSHTEGDITHLSIAVAGGTGAKIVKWNRARGYARDVHTSLVVEANDHAAGALSKTSAGTYIYGNSLHTGADYYIGRGSSFASLTETNIDAALGQSFYTYTNLFCPAGAVYQFGRAGPSAPRPQRYSKSTDDGVTWSAYTTWLYDGGTGYSPYVQFEQDGNRWWFLYSETHPDLAPTGPVDNRIFMGYWENDTVYTLAGVNAGAFPILPHALTLVHDGSATGDNNGGWVWDLKKHSVGMTGAYSSFPTNDNHRYHRVRVISGVVQTEIVVNDAGYSVYGPAPNSQEYYSGGIACHPTNPDIMYASISKPSVHSGLHQIYRLDRVSEGNWSQTQITNEAFEHLRPDTGPGFLTYIKGSAGGNYVSYTDFPGCRLMGRLI